MEEQELTEQAELQVRIIMAVQKLMKNELYDKRCDLTEMDFKGYHNFFMQQIISTMEIDNFNIYQ